MNMWFRWFDSVVIWIWSLEPKLNEEYVAARRIIDDKTGGALYDMDVIDSKSSALLTHISIILAVLAVLINNESTARWFFTVEFVLYALNATILLRCVDILGPPFRAVPSEDTDLRSYGHMEGLIRRTVYQFALRSAAVLTVVLVIGVAVA